MRRFRSLPAVIAIFGIALLCATATLLLPTSGYQRYQLLEGTIHARARWIYERIHFDPTPIDVVVIGSSRTGAGIDAARLGHLTGRNVVNFSLPEAGRNINYAIITEMLTAKTPKLIVLGVTEKPSRTGHSAYRYLAPAAMLVDPAYFGNIKYLADLGYLPYRQLLLFAADIAPGTMGFSHDFDPARYAGPFLDTTADITLPDGTIKRTGQPAALAELERGVRKLETGTNPPILPASLADIEFGDERAYVRRIAAMAKARGIRVVFLAIPYYTGTTYVQEGALYRHFGPLWNAGFLAPHAEYYTDYAHLTRGGARVLTDWVAPMITAELVPQTNTPARR
jgi:hypothetical protein